MQHLTYIDHIKIIATNWGLAFLLFGLFVCVAGIVFIVRWWRTPAEKRSKERIVGAIFLVIAGLVWGYLQTLIPTRYAWNPTRSFASTDEAVAALARPLYDEHCALCHGEHGLGDGPIAEFMMPPPANFSIHGWHHREGEHYWWISRGIFGTGMPSFENSLTEEERWLLARYIKQMGREVRLNIDDDE